MKVAVIGSGISGLGAAYILNAHHDVHIYEKNDYIGGHTRTIELTLENKKIPLDTGFIVFNKHNYPHLTKLFQHLNVPIEKSSMSFGTSIKNGWLEYGSQQAWSMFAQKRNLFRPKFWRMLYDILKFNRHAIKYLKAHPSVTLDQCLTELNLKTWFQQYYLLAMGAAIWSCPVEKMLSFPAQTFIRFFHNHGLLTVNQQPQWYTVIGGSKNYIHKITAQLKNPIKLNCAAQKVTRTNNKIIIQDSQNNQTEFDQVIFACHADQALKMLTQPTQEEQTLLSACQYETNKVIVHRDLDLMPKNKNCWSSWNYLYTEENKVSLSYWMNNLQPLDTKIPIIVTLNPAKQPKANLIHDEYTFEHPVFTKQAIAAQAKLKHIQGQNNTWYCGAYHRYGFHEDGLLSAVNVTKQLGVEPPWN